MAGLNPDGLGRNRSFDDTEQDSVTTEELAIGGTLYEEDDNSPLEFTGQSSHTYTVAGTYDHLVIIPFSVGSLGGTDQLQVNGDTTSNYDEVDTSDALTSAKTEWGTPAMYTVDYIKLQDLLGNRVNYRANTASEDTAEPIRGENANVSGPITQFTLIRGDGNNVDVSARVYGRSLS